MKLHLGCGRRYLKGFVHIDLADFEHIDYKAPINDLSNFVTSSVTEIYCSHAFEYFDRNEAPRVLNEWRRVLKNEGRLYLVVPDFDRIIQIYLQTRMLPDVLGPLFGRWKLNDNFIYHKTVWNENDLKTALREAGFHKVKRFSPAGYLSSIDQDYDDHSLAYFPHMDRSGIPFSLALVAEPQVD